jgi:hypothetical protein
MTEFRPVDPHTDPDWDSFVRASPDGWAWGLAGWQRLIERVPDWGLRPLSFEMRENGQRLALMPFHLNRAGIAASSGWGWVGPMLAHGLPAARRRSVLARVMAEAERLAAEAGAQSIALGSPSMTASALASARGVNPFFALGYDDLSTNALVIDLTLDEDMLWSGLSANARQEIRKARKLGWRAVRASWRQEVDTYYRLHAKTYRRTGTEPHPRAYFDGIAQEMEPAGAAVLWMGLDPDGTPCAFHNDATLNHAMFYHTGCSTESALASGINYLLMWTSITDAKRRGCTHFEVGDVFFNVRDGKQAGLTRFKSKFGGELHRSFKAQKTLDLPRPAPSPAAPAADAEPATQRLRERLPAALRRLIHFRHGGH